MFGPISGAHFNPAISFVSAWNRDLSVNQAAIYISAQIGGAILGVAAAHAMFGLPILQISDHARSTWGERLGEVVAISGW